MQTTTYSAMYTPGTLLRLAREERQLSLADVKLVCKIRESALHAMETDQYERFPNSYMNTFLPEYATFLGVPAKILSESFAKHFPEREDLRTHFSAYALRQIANEQAFATHFSFIEQSRAFVQKNARKSFASALVGVLAWFMVGLGVEAIQSRKGESYGTGAAIKQEQGFWESLLAKVIVSTPENMRGTPFLEMNAAHPAEVQKVKDSQNNRAKLNTLNDVVQLSAEKNEAIRREEEIQQNNANMRVISLAAIVPMQRELQHALEQGFEAIMHDEKADARMRRTTSLASVSLSAAKARLEADAKTIREKNSLGSGEEKEMFFAADMDGDSEDEKESGKTEASVRSKDAGVISNTRLEDLRTDDNAMRARIALIMQTRRFANSSGVVSETQRVVEAKVLHDAHRRAAVSRVEFVELEILMSHQLTSSHVQQPQMQQRFEPIRLPQNWVQGLGVEEDGVNQVANNLAQN